MPPNSGRNIPKHGCLWWYQGSGYYGKYIWVISYHKSTIHFWNRSQTEMIASLHTKMKRKRFILINIYYTIKSKTHYSVHFYNYTVQAYKIMASHDWPGKSHIFHFMLMNTNCGKLHINIWRQGSRSTLAQVMACGLMAPSHSLNQCWFITKGVLWHSPESNFIRGAYEVNLLCAFEDYTFKITTISQGPMRETHVGLASNRWLNARLQ